LRIVIDILIGVVYHANKKFWVLSNQWNCGEDHEKGGHKRKYDYFDQCFLFHTSSLSTFIEVMILQAMMGCEIILYRDKTAVRKKSLFSGY